MDKDILGWIVNGVFAIVTILGGTIMKMFDNRLKGLEDTDRNLPATYARRDDVKDMKTEIVQMLQRIEDKIESKLHG